MTLTRIREILSLDPFSTACLTIRYDNSFVYEHLSDNSKTFFSFRAFLTLSDQA